MYKAEKESVQGAHSGIMYKAERKKCWSVAFLF